MTDYTKLIERINKIPVSVADWKTIEKTVAAIEALQAECAEHKENAMRNARIAVSIRAERDQLQAENERMKRELEISKLDAKEWHSQADALKAKLDELGKGEPIYQYQMGDGSWIDQTKHSYDYNRNHAPNAVVRIVYAAPKALAPLTDKEDWDIRGILASKLRVFHRTTEAEADELISLFASMKSRTPLTQPEVVEAFCNTRHNTQYVSVFDAGVRFAEKHHGIGGTP